MKVVIICGGTATGKSNLAMDLAEKLNAEIINFDSQQVYKDFDIGTAKPSKEELAQIPHHLIGHVDPREHYTAGDFRRDAFQKLSEIKTPYAILVGGTGFYLQALMKGMFDLPPSDPEIKTKLEIELAEKGLPQLYEQLHKRDPLSAKVINPNDKYRILRALEVFQITGRPLGELKATFKPQDFPYPFVKIGVRRTKTRLREIVSQRSQAMIDNGLLDEVKAIMNKYGADVRPLQSVGYKEAFDFLRKNEEIPTHKQKVQLAEQITASTMQLAKRQSTWFKRDSEIQWFDPDTDDMLSAVLTKALKF